jgi:hypothetical protein
VVCNKPFTWRKKWEKVWDEVKYCSDTEVTNNMANKTLRLILGDQLNSNHSWFKNG